MAVTRKRRGLWPADGEELGMGKKEEEKKEDRGERQEGKAFLDEGTSFSVADLFFSFFFSRDPCVAQGI